MMEKLSFEFYQIPQARAFEASEEMERRIAHKSRPIQKKEPTDQDERDFRWDDNMIIDEVIRLNLGVELGKDYEEYKAEIESCWKDDLETEDGEEDDEYSDMDEPLEFSEEESEATFFVDQLREQMREVLRLSSKAQEVFVALVRDEIGKVMGMIGGNVEKGGQDARIISYLLQEGVGLPLHEFMEGKLLELGVQRIYPYLSAVEEFPETIHPLLRERRYYEEDDPEEKGALRFVLDLSTPHDQRPVPPPYVSEESFGEDDFE